MYTRNPTPPDPTGGLLVSNIYCNDLYMLCRVVPTTYSLFFHFDKRKKRSFDPNSLSLYTVERVKKENKCYFQMRVCVKNNALIYIRKVCGTFFFSPSSQRDPGHSRYLGWWGSSTHTHKRQRSSLFFWLFSSFSFPAYPTQPLVCARSFGRDPTATRLALPPPPPPFLSFLAHDPEQARGTHFLFSFASFLSRERETGNNRAPMYAEVGFILFLKNRNSIPLLSHGRE